MRASKSKSPVMLLWKWRQRITQIHIIGKTTLYKSLLYSVCVMATFTQNLHSSVYDRLDYSQANTSTNNGLCKQDILHPGRIYLQRIDIAHSQIYLGDVLSNIINCMIYG